MQVRYHLLALKAYKHWLRTQIYQNLSKLISLESRLTEIMYPEISENKARRTKP